jgi:hypothetical protein
MLTPALSKLMSGTILTDLFVIPGNNTAKQVCKINTNGEMYNLKTEHNRNSVTTHLIRNSIDGVNEQC